MSVLFRSAPQPVRERESRDISFQSMFGRALDLRDGGSSYSAIEAMQLSAVSACVERRANYLAQLPFDAYRQGPGGTSVAVSPQPIVIARPSAKGIPRSLWLKHVQYSRLLWGNATLIIGSRDGAGYPKSLDVLPPWDVAFTNTGITERLQVTVGGQPIDAADVIIIPGHVRPGSVVGVAPLAASGLVDLGRKAQTYGRDWFASSCVPASIVYSDDRDMTAEQADGIVRAITSKWRKRKPAVLGSGLRYEQVSVKADESQFLETIRQNMAEIAIVLGMAPEDIGVAMTSGSVTYANREQRTQQTLVDTVNNDLLLMQEVLYGVVPQPQFVRFSTGALLRTDLQARYASYRTGIEAGFLEPNEARAWEDLPPIAAPVVDVAARSFDDLTAEVRDMLTNRTISSGNETHIHLPDSLSVEMRQEPVVIPAPIVNVPPAQVTVNVEPTPVNVTVEAPVVTVEAPNVQVDVHMPDEESDTIERIRFERDADGNIIGAVKGVG